MANAFSTAWVIGSIKGLDYDVTITPDGSPPSLENIAGDRYLYVTGGGSLSILGGMVSAMSSAGLGGPAAVLTRDRKVRLSAAGVFSVTWTDATLRDLLGFTGDLAGASSYVAPNVSPLLWSPAKPLLPERSPWQTAGIRTPLAYFSASPSDGSTFVVSHGSRVDQTYSAVNVATARVFTSAELGGEWVALFDQCLARGYSFYVFPSVTEESGSTTTATPSGGLGPYALTPQGRAPSWDYVRSRGFDYVDSRNSIRFSCRVVPEYT